MHNTCLEPLCKPNILNTDISVGLIKKGVQYHEGRKLTKPISICSLTNSFPETTSDIFLTVASRIWGNKLSCERDCTDPENCNQRKFFWEKK